MVTTTDKLDRKAVAAAGRYMGTVAWPTVILALLLGAAYLASVALTLTGLFPLWLAVPVVAVLVYLSYTVLHESVHGSITGSDPSLRWLNKTLGYLAAWITMIPLTAHKHEHMAHHRSANHESEDPDYHVGDMGRSLLSPLRAVVLAWSSQISFYATHRWKAAPAKQNLVLCLEVSAAVLPRLTVIAMGFWVEGLALFVLAWLIGAVVLLYLFAYLVHRPHAEVGRYRDTSTILLPRVLSWLWMFQNYHSIHHLFPRVPFYEYASLFAEIEETMVAKGAPIYRLTSSGLSGSAAHSCNDAV